MMNNPEITSTLQELVNILDESIKWEEDAMHVAQKLGLQGEKRRNRYESAKNSDLLKYIRCFAYDMFMLTIKPMGVDVSVAPVGDFKGYFMAYQKKLITMYETMHTIANKLVTLGIQPVASCVYKRIKCIMDDIIDINRVVEEGTQTNWSPEFIFLYQISARNTHDYFEEKEKDNKYEY